MMIVYALHGGPYDGDFVGFQEPRTVLDVALPAWPMDQLLSFSGPIHVKALMSLQGAVVQPRYGSTGRIGRYQAREKQPLILEWQGEVEPKGD
jgi:hypothetical protein